MTSRTPLKKFLDKGQLNTDPKLRLCLGEGFFDDQRRLTEIFLERINRIDMILRLGIVLTTDWDVWRMEYLMNITKGWDGLIGGIYMIILDCSLW